MKVFEEGIVKQNPNYFLAGRGGETNLHQGNYEVRRRVLNNTGVYAALSPRERGQKFSRKVIDQDLKEFTFVVRLSYFWRNYENGKIASVKLESVVKEHGSLSVLRGFPHSSYVTIGEIWCLNIIGAILRQATGKLNPDDPQPPKPKPPRVPCVKRKTRTSTQRENDQEDDGERNSPETHNTITDAPVQDSVLDTTKSSLSIPEDTSHVPLAKRHRVSFDSVKMPEAATSRLLLPFTARRLSRCPSPDQGSRASVVEAVSFGGCASFYPIETRPERATRIPRMVSADSSPLAAPDDVMSLGGRESPLDPLEYMLDDWDTEKWPQFDLHDLLSF